MKSFGDFKNTPDNKKAELIRSIPTKDVLTFLEQKTDDKDNSSLVNLCFSKPELHAATLEKLTELARAAKQRNDEAIIQSLNRLMVLPDSIGYAGWFYVAGHNNSAQIQLLLSIADIKLFNQSMACQAKDGVTGWHVLARHQNQYPICVEAFMRLADATLFNQAMLHQSKNGWTGWHVVVRNQKLRECIDVFITLADTKSFNQAMLMLNETRETGWKIAFHEQKSGDFFNLLIKKLNIFYCSDMTWVDQLTSSLGEKDVQHIKLIISIFNNPINFIYAMPEDFLPAIINYVNTSNDLEGVRKLENALNNCMRIINHEIDAPKSKLDDKLESIERRKQLFKNVKAKLAIYKQQLMVKKGLMLLRKFNDTSVKKSAFLTEDFVEASQCFLEYGAGANSFEAHKEVGLALVDGLGSFIYSSERAEAPLPNSNTLLALSLASSCYKVFIDGLMHFQQAVGLMDFPLAQLAPKRQPVPDLKDVKGVPSPVPLDQVNNYLPDENWIVMYKACLGINADEKLTDEQIKEKCDAQINALTERAAKLPAEWGLLSDTLKTVYGKFEPADKKFLIAFAAEKFRYEISDDLEVRNQHRENMHGLVVDFIKIKQSKAFGIKWFQSGIPVEKLTNIQRLLEKMHSPKAKLLQGG